MASAPKTTLDDAWKVVEGLSKDELQIFFDAVATGRDLADTNSEHVRDWLTRKREYDRREAEGDAVAGWACDEASERELLNAPEEKDADAAGNLAATPDGKAALGSPAVPPPPTRGTTAAAVDDEPDAKRACRAAAVAAAIGEAH